MQFFDLHFKISRKYKSCLVKFDILPNCGQNSSYSERMTKNWLRKKKFNYGKKIKIYLNKKKKGIGKQINNLY